MPAQQGAPIEHDGILVSPPARYGVMTGQVTMFLSQLRKLPLATWSECAGEPCAPSSLDDVEGDATSETARVHAARERLRLAQQRAPELTARIHRRIDDELSVFEGMVKPGAVDRMREAARQAACALAMRPSLDPGDFQRLYAPFATAIALGELADAS